MVKISVITTCLNSENTIEKTILSVIKNGYENTEHIIIDAGSSDSTLNIIKKYKHLVPFVNSGISIPAAWNFGISVASGDVIYILNADDFVDEDVFLKVNNELRSLDNLSILFGNVRIINKNGLTLREFIGSLPTKLNLYKGIPFLHPSVFVPKSVYKKIGLFDEGYSVGFDSDWLLRAYSSGVKFIKLEIWISMTAGGLSENKSLVGFGEYIHTLRKYSLGEFLIVMALLNKAAVIFKRLIFHTIN